MEAAPRRAAVRGDLRQGHRATVVAYFVDPVNRSETTPGGVREFYVVMGSPTIGVSLGSTTMGDFARVDVHAGEFREDAWLLEAHAG
jgi:hypothetical protein